MDNGTVALRLLSLFSTRQRALEIEGDLLEESERHGRFWFITHVLSVTLALFRASLTEAPYRIAALGAVAITLAFLTCSAQNVLFLSPDAFYHSPLLGMLAIPAFACLIGSGLVYFAPDLAVRVATLTAMILCCMLLFTLLGADSLQAPATGSNSLMPLLGTVLSIAVAFVEGIVLFIGPLLVSSVYCRDHLAAK